MYIHCKLLYIKFNIFICNYQNVLLLKWPAFILHNMDELLVFNNVALIIDTVDWWSLRIGGSFAQNNMVSHDVTINSITFWQKI